MTSRDRVLTALNHEEPDRVPLFVGTSGVTTMLGPGYDRLKRTWASRGCRRAGFQNHCNMHGWMKKFCGVWVPSAAR